MKKSVTQLWVTALTGILCLGVVFTFSATKNLSSQREVQGAGAGAPTLKLTWDFSANNSTSTTEFTDVQLKDFLELYDAPSYTYTISTGTALAKVFKGSGTTASPNYHYDCLKFSTGSVSGKFTASGLPSFTLVKIWSARWSDEAATLQVNGGTAQSITTNNYDLYTFDGFNAQTSFSVLAVKRSMINKIEFWGC